MMGSARLRPTRASGWRLLLALIVAYVAAQLAGALTLYALVGFPISPMQLQHDLAALQFGRNVALSSAVGELAMPIVAWLFLRRFLGARELRLGRLRRQDLWQAAVLLIVIVLLSGLFGSLLHTGDIRSQVGLAADLRSGWWEAPAIAVSAGLAEELLFRGYLLEGLRRIGPTWLAVLGSAVAFGLAHLTWGITGLQFLFYVLLGVLFAVTVLRQKSLWPAIFAHAAWDGLALMLLMAKGPG